MLCYDTTLLPELLYGAACWRAIPCFAYASILSLAVLPFCPHFVRTSLNLFSLSFLPSPFPMCAICSQKAGIRNGNVELQAGTGRICHSAIGTKGNATRPACAGYDIFYFTQCLGVQLSTLQRFAPPILLQCTMFCLFQTLRAREDGQVRKRKRGCKLHQHRKLRGPGHKVCEP